LAAELFADVRSTHGSDALHRSPNGGCLIGARVMHTGFGPTFSAGNSAQPGEEPPEPPWMPSPLRPAAIRTPPSCRRRETRRAKALPAPEARIINTRAGKAGFDRDAAGGHSRSGSLTYRGARAAMTNQLVARRLTTTVGDLLPLVDHCQCRLF
jgi:hypothetical protein